MKDVPEEHPFLYSRLVLAFIFHISFSKTLFINTDISIRNVTFGISQIFLLFNNQSTKQRRNKHQLSLPKEFISV